MTLFLFKNYPCRSSIFLQPILSQEVLTLINTLKQNNASIHDDIFPYFLKLQTEVTSADIKKKIKMVVSKHLTHFCYTIRLMLMLASTSLM